MWGTSDKHFRIEFNQDDLTALGSERFLAFFLDTFSPKEDCTTPANYDLEDL